MNALEALTVRGAAPRPLENIGKLLERLGHPERSYRVVQVAGTNGKGSVCAMLESVLRASSLRVGLFTSPALTDIRERIRINGELISERDLARLAGRVIAEEPLGSFSGFDRLTMCAALYFAEQRVDVAVFECGLGGRLDPTTVLKRHTTVLTRIALDHTETLGHSIEEIAEEKARVMQKNVPAILAVQEPSVLNVLHRYANDVGAPVFQLTPENVRPITSDLSGQTFSLSILGFSYEHDSLRISLPGGHQLENAAVAAQAAYAFHPPTEDALRRGLQSAKWPCRFECFKAPGRARVILDGAHNPSGAKALADAIERLLPFPPALLFAARSGKDANQMLKALRGVSRVFVADFEGNVPAHELKAACDALDLPCQILQPGDALECALASCHEDDTLVVAGSLYFAGKIRQALA